MCPAYRLLDKQDVNIYVAELSDQSSESESSLLLGL